jgi:hypothetical protein
MPWYIRAGGAADDPNLPTYATVDDAMRQTRMTLYQQTRNGRKVSADPQGHNLIHEGQQLIDTIWVEDEDGKVIPVEEAQYGGSDPNMSFFD